MTVSHPEIIFYGHKMKYIIQRLPAGYILHEVEYGITKYCPIAAAVRFCF